MAEVLQLPLMEKNKTMGRRLINPDLLELLAELNLRHWEQGLDRWQNKHWVSSAYKSQKTPLALRLARYHRQLINVNKGNVLERCIFQHGYKQTTLQGGHMGKATLGWERDERASTEEHWKRQRNLVIQRTPQGKLPSNMTTSLRSCTGGFSASVLPSSPFLLSAFFTIFTAGEALAARNWFWKCSRSASDSPGFGLDNILPACSCSPALRAVHMKPTEDMEKWLQNWISWGEDGDSKGKLFIFVPLCCSYTYCSCPTSGSRQDTISYTRVPDKLLNLFLIAEQHATRQAAWSTSQLGAEWHPSSKKTANKCFTARMPTTRPWICKATEAPGPRQQIWLTPISTPTKKIRGTVSCKPPLSSIRASQDPSISIPVRMWKPVYIDLDNALALTDSALLLTQISQGEKCFSSFYSPPDLVLSHCPLIGRNHAISKHFHSLPRPVLGWKQRVVFIKTFTSMHTRTYYEGNYNTSYLPGMKIFVLLLTSDPGTVNPFLRGSK